MTESWKNVLDVLENAEKVLEFFVNKIVELWALTAMVVMMILMTTFCAVFYAARILSHTCSMSLGHFPL